MGDRLAGPTSLEWGWSLQVLHSARMGIPQRPHGGRSETAWAHGHPSETTWSHGHPSAPAWGRTETAWAHGHPSETAQGGGASPIITGIAKFHPKCVNSVRYLTPPRHPPEFVRWSGKTEDGHGGEPAPFTPLPTPSLSSMSDSFLKSKFDMGDRSSVPGVQGKVWSWQVLHGGRMGTPPRPHGHPMEAAWAPHRGSHRGRMGTPPRPHGHPTEGHTEAPWAPHRGPMEVRRPSSTELTNSTPKVANPCPPDHLTETPPNRSRNL